MKNASQAVPVPKYYARGSNGESGLKLHALDQLRTLNPPAKLLFIYSVFNDAVCKSSGGMGKDLGKLCMEVTVVCLELELCYLQIQN